MKFSLSNFPIDNLPPVLLWLVKSPPWHMNWGMMWWKLLPLKPKPFPWVHRQRKFSGAEKGKGAGVKNI